MCFEYVEYLKPECDIHEIQIFQLYIATKYTYFCVTIIFITL